ncbi:DUF4241 domain-containing protein [Glycomyces paridis]|uniref:DUF4241 domain-containing protein n=1 Tax=Glycomyces paridis TaxID=2126555 RepID=A0A4V4HNL0_9ACTN|nr:DUF4241 domain-containing protein [Glycomyces paridis]THV26456.1 DUF4241 domain-containing protein [Glycomyces paridis]
MAYAPDLSRLLQPGFSYPDKHGATVTITPLPIGPSVCPTGRIVGCDPLVNRDADPFLVAVEPGTYQLTAWVAVFVLDGAEVQRRNAALELRISEEATAAWEMATTRVESDVDGLGDDGFFGYSVDAGCGTLADHGALRPLVEDEYGELVDELLLDEMDWEAPIKGIANAVTDEATGANVAVVGSGWGDGAYPTFIGRDEAGAVTCYVTDFLVIADPVE